jgi:hypothetical protein
MLYLTFEIGLGIRSAWIQYCLFTGIVAGQMTTVVTASKFLIVKAELSVNETQALVKSYIEGIANDLTPAEAELIDGKIGTYSRIAEIDGVEAAQAAISKDLSSVITLPSSGFWSNTGTFFMNIAYSTGNFCCDHPYLVGAGVVVVGGAGIIWYTGAANTMFTWMGLMQESSVAASAANAATGAALNTAVSGTNSVVSGLVTDVALLQIRIGELLGRVNELNDRLSAANAAIATLRAAGRATTVAVGNLTDTTWSFIRRSNFAVGGPQTSGWLELIRSIGPILEGWAA